MPTQTIFERIASKEIPGFIVWEDENHIAFLDIKPMAKGHILVVPRKNIGDELFELSAEEYTNLMNATKHVATLLKTKLELPRVFMIVEGLEVPHVHIHLIPGYKGSTLNLLKRKEATKLELQDIYNKIVS